MIILFYILESSKIMQSILFSRKKTTEEPLSEEAEHLNNGTEDGKDQWGLR